MASLLKYVADGTHSGSKENIWVQIVFFFCVGSGEVTGFELFKFAFKGKIDTVFYKGDLNIAVELLDHNEAASNGPCAVFVNGVEDKKAKYHVDGAKIVLECDFDGVKQNIAMYKIEDGKQTAIDLSGKYNNAVHLAPV